MPLAVLKDLTLSESADPPTYDPLVAIKVSLLPGGRVGIVHYPAVLEDAHAEHDYGVEAGGGEGFGVGFQDIFEEVDAADV